MSASSRKSEVKGFFGLYGLAVGIWLDLEYICTNVKRTVGSYLDYQEVGSFSFSFPGSHEVPDVAQLGPDPLPGRVYSAGRRGALTC